MKTSVEGEEIASEPTFISADLDKKETLFLVAVEWGTPIRLGFWEISFSKGRFSFSDKSTETSRHRTIYLYFKSLQSLKVDEMT